MNKTKKQDFALMSILKVTEINRIICETNMGVLKLRIRKGENDYRFVLDSVELPKDLHKEIYELLYAPEVVQPKNILTWNGVPIQRDSKEAQLIIELNPDKTGVVKPKGRPVGSKNKLKDESAKA